MKIENVNLVQGIPFVPPWLQDEFKILPMPQNWREPTDIERAVEMLCPHCAS